MNERNKKRILLADNSTEYRRSVRGILELEGYIVEEATTPKYAQDKIRSAQFDLALVEVRLRDEDDVDDLSGLELAKSASEHGIPSIIVTAYPSVESARTALQSLGVESLAKDLISKASGPEALLDSIRRTLQVREDLFRSSEVRGLFIDREKQLVWINGKLINLSPKQYLLLEELYKKPGGVSTYAELIRAIYGEDVPIKDAFYDKRLRNLVARTKAKIEEVDSPHQYLESIAGLGFRLNQSFAGDPTTDAPPPLKKKKGK